MSIPGAAFLSAKEKPLRGLASGRRQRMTGVRTGFNMPPPAADVPLTLTQAAFLRRDVARILSRLRGDGEQQASVRGRLLFARSGGGALVQEACAPAAAAQIDLFDRDRARVHWSVGRRDLDGHIGFGNVVPPRDTRSLNGHQTRAGSIVLTPPLTKTTARRRLRVENPRRG